MKDATENGKIDTFLLKNESGDNASVKGRHWNGSEIYLNDICIAVCMEPTDLLKAGKRDSNDKLIAEAKEELYAMLRGISQLALEHDLLRPVACIVSKKSLEANPALPVAVKKWGSDQDWHRGAFTLYVEAEKDEKGHIGAEGRVNDLLLPEIEAIEEEKSSRTAEEIAEEFKNFYQTKFQDDEDAMALGNAFAEECVIDEKEAKKRIDDWKSSILAKAEKIARGETKHE